MATQFHLTDPDMAVYRPWVWLKFAGATFAINHPSGLDQKFRWLKDFRWTLSMNNQGSAIEFTIFEDRAGWNIIWPGILADSITSAGENLTYFQWGWSGRSDDGKAINAGSSLTGGSGTSFMRNTNTSSVHSMVVSKMDVEYAEGGINYRFSGTDPFALTQAQDGKGTERDKTFQQAVTTLLYKAKNSLPAGYGERTAAEGYTREFREEFDIRQKRRWPENGFPLLMTIQKWTSQLRSKKNESRVDHNKVAPLIMPDTEAGKEKLVFTTSYRKGSDPLFEVHVNPPEPGPLGVGKHTAINIRPEFSGAMMWALFPQTIRSGKMYRDVQHNEGAGPEMDGGKQGVPAEIASPSVDDPLTGPQATEAMAGLGAGIASGGSNYVPLTMEVEILGMPMLDHIGYLGDYIDLKLWNTSYIDDDLKWKRESRIPSSAINLLPDNFPKSYGLYDPRFSDVYILTGVSHSMNSEGAYTTTVKLTPGGGGFKVDKSTGTRA